jgi:hypothetical protein
MQFDERSLLSELIAARIFVRVGHCLAFKYRFFHIFFLGRYVATRPSVLSDFIQQDSYIKTSGLVEVIAEIASDNSALVEDIVSKLEAALEEFGERYIPETFDPFARLEWPSHQDEEEQLWKPLSQMIAAGPRNVSEIDEIKRSLLAEGNARNQIVVFEKFDRLERRLVAYHRALVEALKK